MGRAARFHKVGAPLEIEEVPRPKVGPQEVLLRVKAASMCHTDLHLMDGILQAAPPVALGHEIAGEVDEVGPNVEGFKEGDRAVVHIVSPCGECRYCLQGRGMECEALFGRPMYGGTVDGGYAEYCKVQADRLVPFPQDLPPSFAATLGCAGLTAYHAVNAVGEVALGDNVGVYGAGGVGLYALQLARLGGARVIAIGRSPEKLKMARQLGADDVIDASVGKVADQLKGATEGRGIDVMFDFVANDESVANSFSALANGGRMVLVGLSGKPLTVDPGALALRGISLRGTLLGTKGELAEVVRLARGGRLQSVVSRKFVLDEINEALESLRSGEIAGRGYVSI